jgi:ADP-heptose:LPS heptosyltransferase
LPKILIVRFSSIGDIVLTSPIIRCLKNQVPGAEIHYLTKKSYKELVETNPRIDKFFLLEKSLTKLLPALKMEGYDYIVDLHNNLRSKRVGVKLGVKTYTFKKLNIYKWLLVNFKINLLPKEHLVDRYFNALKSLGVMNDGKGLDFFIPEQDRVPLTSLPASHQNGYIAFVIGANYSTKRLPLSKIISLCKKINKPIVLLGWKNEEHNGNEIQKEVPLLVYNGCGIFNINQSASLVEQASLIISHDTGLMHIAAAFKKRIISIWGNTVPEFGMWPYLEKNLYTTIEVKGLSCRPCSKIGFSQCPKGHFKCMEEINEEEVLRAINPA